MAHPLERKLKAIRAAMFQLGYSEAISSTFASAAETEVFAPESAAVALENPLQEEAANLRPSLLPGMITMVAHNLNRDVLTVRLFEAGGVFRGSAEEVVETESLALGLTGFVPATAIHSAQDAPFFELKGALEALLALFETSAPVYRTDDVPAAFETRRAAVVLLGQQQIASFGQLAQSVATEHKLRQPVYVAEVKLSSLLALPLKHTMAQELSRFQAVERDFSFTFAEGTQWKAVAGAIRKLGIPELRSVNVVEVFRDAKKLPGHFSMLVRLVFQSSDRTLVEGELAAWSGAVIEALQSLGGGLRG